MSSILQIIANKENGQMKKVVRFLIDKMLFLFLPLILSLHMMTIFFFSEPNYKIIFSTLLGMIVLSQYFLDLAKFYSPKSIKYDDYFTIGNMFGTSCIYGLLWCACKYLQTIYQNSLINKSLGIVGGIYIFIAMIGLSRSSWKFLSGK